MFLNVTISIGIKKLMEVWRTDIESVEANLACPCYVRSFHLR